MLKCGDIGFKLTGTKTSPTVHLYYKDKYAGLGLYYAVSLDDLYSTMDRQLNIAYSMIDSYRESYLIEIDKHIKSHLQGARYSFLSLGIIFKKMQKYGLFPNGGYGNNDTKLLYAYIDDKYGFKKSSVCNMIAIVDKFCDYKTNELLPEYEKFSYTQLTELLPIVDTPLLKEVSSDMTIKEIRDLKHGDDDEEDVQLTGQSDANKEPKVKLCPHCNGLLA